VIRHARRLTAVAVAIVVAACGKAERRSAESPADSAAHALERSQESLGTARQQGAEQAVRAGLAALRAGSHPSESARVQRPVPQAPARKRTPPLQVGFLRPDGVVLVEFLVADSTQRVRGTDSARAWLPMPERWYITPSDAPPFDARGGLEVLAYLGESEAGPIWRVGQVTGARWAGDSTRSPVRLALGRPLPAAFFLEDSSASPIRNRLIALVQAEFTDSARRAMYKDRPDLGPIGRPAPITNVRIWHAPIPDRDDTLHVIQAERRYSGAEIWIFDLWVVQTGAHLEAVRRRGPAYADMEYKGAASETPTALFRYNGRTLVVYSLFGYEGGGLVIAELSGHHVAELTQ